MTYINSFKSIFLTYFEEFLIKLSQNSTKFCVWGILEEVEIPMELLLEFENSINKIK